MVGYDEAGKTTALFKLKLGKVTDFTPTIGMNVQEITHQNITFTCMDMGGGIKVKQLWREYYKKTSGIIYVLDSSDQARLEGNKKEIHDCANDQDLNPGAPILVLANKQDLDTAMSVEDLTKALELESISNRKWHI